MSDERSDAEQVLNELEPQPAHEAIPVSRRQTLRALASVGALTTVGSASGQSAGTVIADEAVFSNYGWESSAEGGTLTIDGDQYTFDGSGEIGLPDGGVGTELVTPDEIESELIGPSGQVLFRAFTIPDSVFSHRYVGSNDTDLHAVNASDGTEEWTYSTGGGIYSSPAVVDGTVYVGSDDGDLHAVNASDGTEEWTYSTGGGIYYSSTIGIHDGWTFASRPGVVGNTEPLQP